MEEVVNLTNTPSLETERLILRKFDANDIKALFDIFSDEEVNVYLPMLPLKTLEEAKVFFEEKYEKAYQQPSGYKYAVCLKTNNIPIGYVNLSGDEARDLGYGLKKEYWHKGIVGEACKVIVEQVKKSGIPYITATHDINNPRSGNVMKNIGMAYCYSYEEQWQPKNILVTFRMYQLNLDGVNDRIYKEYWDSADIRFVEADI
jgi:RimJ/RimL family protein N-acetyltransferase